MGSYQLYPSQLYKSWLATTQESVQNASEELPNILHRCEENGGLSLPDGHNYEIDLGSGPLTHSVDHRARFTLRIGFEFENNLKRKDERIPI